MSDFEAEQDDNVHPFDGDDQAHQACYEFRPFTVDDDLDQEQPAKKRRKTKTAPEEPLSTFPLLDHGNESAIFAQLRHDTFQYAWTRKQARIHELVESADNTALEKIVDFIETAEVAGSEKLKTGLIVSGPDGNAQSRLLERWKERSKDDSDAIIVELQASHCANLQNTLKNVIRSAIVSRAGQHGYQEFLNKNKRLIPLNFDLELLQIFVKESGIPKIILSILDVETFDIGILSELFSMLSSWSESIPFVILLGIATTVDLFESRLPKSSIDMLDATTFTLQSSSDLLVQILDDFRNDPDQDFKFGLSTFSALEQLCETQGMTIDAFTRAIKYIVMSHFFANSLSVLLASTTTSSHHNTDAIPQLTHNKSLCKSIRNTSSFQTYIEDLLRTSTNKNKHKTLAQDLLTNDTSLISAAIEACNSESTKTSSNTPHFTLPEAHTITTARHLLQQFTPRPRQAIERALSRPADYLNCECCTTSTSSSPTSILYTLLQEAGTVINVRDLYDAFQARCFSDPEDGAEVMDESTNPNTDRHKMAVFYTSLAELRMLGLVKGSSSAGIKKRALASGSSDAAVLTGRGKERYGDVDFIAKTGWAGL